MVSECLVHEWFLTIRGSIELGRRQHKHDAEEENKRRHKLAGQ
jgi:hypothetical protein